jgi:hypothetical protein
MIRRALAVLLCLTAAAGVAAPAAGASGHARRARARRTAAAPLPVPAGFVGMNLDGPLFRSGDGISLADQMAKMVRSGVQTIRVTFSWQDAQPYPSWSDVPADQMNQFVDVGGIPTDFAETDAVVSLAALYGLKILPVVIYAPSWDSVGNPNGIPIPAQVGPYTNYLIGLIDRYGPRGTYWQTISPALPIRQWQIWNEPNFPYYWTQPSLPGYARLLEAAHHAIAGADPGAKTVLGAITNLSWQYLAQLLRVPGARGAFDVAAVNAFSSTAARVVEILGLDRRALDAGGDRHVPMLATETSWTSAGHGEDWDTTAAGQAHHIAALLPLLGADRRMLNLRGFDYYTWIGDETGASSDWNYAGLLKDVAGRAVPKPALAAFTHAALTLEGCTRPRHRPADCPAG